jgi:hypothetical protein
MIEHCQKHGWTFIFSAANQDAFTTASSYGISGAHTTNYVNTAQGLAASYACTSGTLRNLRTDVTNQAVQASLANLSQVKI